MIHLITGWLEAGLTYHFGRAVCFLAQPTRNFPFSTSTYFRIMQIHASVICLLPHLKLPRAILSCVGAADPVSGVVTALKQQLMVS